MNYSGFHKSTSANTSEFGFHLGGIAECPVSERFSVQGELLFSRKGGSIGTGPVISKLGYIEHPLIAKIYMGNKFSFHVGPQIGCNISEKTEIFDQELGADVKTIDAAILAGFGFKFSEQIFIQTRYGYRLSEVFNDEDFKNSVISFSVGYMF